MSQDINSDPEAWELTEKFGDRALRVWLEILSVGDRNDGFIGHDSPQLYAIFAAKCRVYSPKVRAIFVWCLGRSWLVNRDGFRIANFAKYHRPREPKPFPSEPILSEPILTYPSKEKKEESLTLPDWLPEIEWQAFKDHRKKLKKPLSRRAETLAIARLGELRGQGYDPGAVIDNSILNGWQGLFPPRGRDDEAQRPNPASDRIKRALLRGL